jgi:hypothetical protein
MWRANHRVPWRTRLGTSALQTNCRSLNTFHKKRGAAPLIQFNQSNQWVSTAGTANGTWGQQATTAEVVRCKVLGALDERLPANDNDLIERAAA